MDYEKMPLHDSKIWHNSCHGKCVMMTIMNDGVFFSLVSFLFPFLFLVLLLVLEGHDGYDRWSE